MLVSHRNEFIFTKTSKTAGTSVEVFFEPYCLPEGEWEFRHARDQHVSSAGIIGYRGSDLDLDQISWWNHMPAERIRDQIGKEVWDRYFKFTVVRNLVDKVVSAFHYVRRVKDVDGMRSRLRSTFQRLRWPDEDERTRMLFRAWVRRGRLPMDRDKYLIDEEVCVDYFIRYEDLETGIRNVCDSVGLPFDATRIPHLKVGNRDRDFASYYDRETADRVARAYAFELEHFGYEYPLRNAA